MSRKLEPKPTCTCDRYPTPHNPLWCGTPTIKEDKK